VSAIVDDHPLLASLVLSVIESRLKDHCDVDIADRLLSV
jgi:hypothetical protein